MHQPALPWTIRHENIRVCQYCDEEIRGEPLMSNTSGHPATLCSPSCKTLYEKAAIKQGQFRWDVT